ncbi:MAG: phospholipase D-like domain-containing protein [Oscillochloridaceae bacterium umkhey_bin13]
MHSFSSRLSWFLALLVLLALFGRAALTPRSSLVALGVDPVALGLERAPVPAGLATGGQVAVFFTTPELSYPDLAQARIAPAPERALLRDLAAARHSIDIASFEYNLASIAEALITARARGVEVRLALDRDCLEHPAMARWAGWVEDAGIQISWQQGSQFLHSKFVVIDGLVVWTGSWNLTTNDTYRNNNNLLRIMAPELVANYQAEFAQMFDGAFGKTKRILTPFPLAQAGPLRVANYFSPHESVRPQVLAQIEAARSQIDVLAFAFTDPSIGAALAERQAAGVPVRVVFETRNIRGTGSQQLALLEAGIEVLPDGNCYTMHHKVIIIDQRVVITGSYNFTGRAEDVNDENLLIIHDPQLARAYQAEFGRVYGQARAPTRCQ